MSFLEALILGIIQGLTEFLPVSSSGHLELAKAFLNINLEENVIFSTLLHLATSLSTVFIFRKDITTLLFGILRGKKKQLKMASLLILSSVPILVVGLFFKDKIELFFNSPILLVSICLAITGILLILTAFTTSVSNKKVSIFSAFVIGLSQAVAILPGISRSGATIATSLLLGINRQEATRFSFLMVLIPIWGASLIGIKDILENSVPLAFSMINPLIIGFGAAFLTGLLTCQWMIALVQKGKIIYFGIYCLMVASLSITYYFTF